MCVLQTREYSYNGHTMQVKFKCTIVIVAILYLKILVKWVMAFMSPYLSVIHFLIKTIHSLQYYLG